jgi:adenylate kinase
VVDHFRDEGVLVEVDGEAAPDEVFDRIRDVVEA